MGDLAGDEGKAALDQVEQRVVRGSVRIVDVVVQRHPGVGDEIERGAVGKADAGRGIGPGLDDVVLVDRVADVQRHRYAVAHHCDIADGFLDAADRAGRHGRLRLRILSGGG